MLASSVVAAAASSGTGLAGAAPASGGLDLLVVVDVLGHLPDLHDVVLADGADHPGVVGVPGEVGDLCCVSAVDEEQLGGTVFGVLGALLLANLGQVPDVQPAVGAGGGEDCLVVGGPLDLCREKFIEIYVG